MSTIKSSTLMLGAPGTLSKVIYGKSHIRSWIRC